MKQCQKWWNEEQTATTEKEFLAKHGNLTTQGQVLDALVETTWRAALEWLYKEAKELEEQPESPIDGFNLIEEELKE